MSNKSNAKSFPRNMSNNTLFGGNGGLRPGTKVPVAAERTMQVMTRCAAGNDCLCEHVNFEYLKHVLIKFMTSREHEVRKDQCWKSSFYFVHLSGAEVLKLSG